MKLTKLPFLEKKQKAEYYLALILENEKATSVIFEKIGNSIKFISSHHEYFETSLEDATSENFLETLDTVITQAENALPNNIETQNTIFGLKENWIEDNKIKKEYLDRLKKASDELGLKPIGFLIFSESIINLLLQKEGAPVTAILANIGKKYITVSLVKAGKILETKSAEIHQSPAYTVDTLLKHFQTPEVMPARIIIYDQEDEGLEQEFIGHQWSKSLPFLHLPQIVTLPTDASVKAMLLGAATQMGAKLLDSPVLISNEPTENLPKEESEKDEAEELKDSQTEVNQTDELKENDAEIVPPLENAEKKTNLDYLEDNLSQDFFGFKEGADVAKIKIDEEKVKELPSDSIQQASGEIEKEFAIEQTEQNQTTVNATMTASKAKEFLKSIPLILKKIKFDKLVKFLGNSNKKLLVIPLILFILFISVLYFYLFNTKATITLLVSPNNAQNSANVTFSTSESSDIANKIISAEMISVSEEGTVSQAVTGKKDVGANAKGNVTIFNNSDSTQTFSADTAIKTASGLEFTLDKGITVASASGDIFSGTTPGTGTVSVSASEIGQEYNLPSGTKFSIGSNASIAGKNDNAFSGGSKKQVTVVSKTDIQKLLDKLPKQLEAKAKTKVLAKVSSEKSVLPNFVEETVENKSFDKKENDQASQITLKGTVSFKTIAYLNSDILNLASSLFKDNDKLVSKNNFSVEAKNIVLGKNNDVSADLNLKVNLLPKIDQVALISQIKGMPLSKARNMLSNISQVDNVGIVFSPDIPLLPKNLPGNERNITVFVTAK